MKQYYFSLLLFFSILVFPLTAQNGEPNLSSQAAVLLDAATGAVLFDKNGDHRIPPASLAKLMTIHIALNEVYEGKASLDEVVELPRQSWAINQPPRSSLMYLSSGQIVTLRELLLGLAIPSGNDAAVAVALRFAPTIEAFAERMNQESQGFGLSVTHFVEPSGVSEDNMTTAKEFAFFCQEYLRMHPETLQDYHSVREFVFPKAENLAASSRGRPSTVIRHNNNNLLGTFEGVDGLKTGYIDESGYNIAITAERDQTRFIAIILGAGAVRLQDEDSRKLLAWGFERFKTLRPELEPLTPLPIWKGKAPSVALGVPETLTFTVEQERGNNLYWEREVADPLIAPLPAHSKVGELILYDDLGELRRFPLMTAVEVEEGNFFRRLWDTIRLFFRSLKTK